MTKTIKEKEPGIAAALNIIPGLGYLYLGTRKAFAILLLVSLLLTVISYFDPATSEYIAEAATEEMEVSIFALGGFVAMLLLVAAFIIDAYQEAKRLNKKLSK